MFEPLLPGEPDRFELRRGPDGVYRIDGRAVPIADESSEGRVAVDDRQSIVRVASLPNMGVGFLGVARGMDVKERKLKLVPTA